MILNRIRVLVVTSAGMIGILAWLFRKFERGDKPTMWGNMSQSARLQFRRAFRDALWIPLFLLSLALVVDTAGAVFVSTYKWGQADLYLAALKFSAILWLAREFVRVWWYVFRVRQKELRITRRFSVDLRPSEQIQYQSDLGRQDFRR